MSLCISTVVSSNHYQYFIPAFVYTAKLAYPDAGIRIFLLGKLKSDVRQIVEEIQKKYTDIKILEDSWKGKIKSTSTCNSLRFLIDKKYYKGYDYIMIKDIDFLVFKHKESHFEAMKNRMNDAGLPYFTLRSALKAPRRPEINKDGWGGAFTRLVAGMVLLKNPQFFTIAEPQLIKYLTLLKKNKPDRVDYHLPCSYREYDEVMLYRILTASHLRTPKTRYKYVDGKGFSSIYRDIHLGDFNKPKKRKYRVASKKIAPENIRNYLVLERDPFWQKVKKTCCNHSAVRTLFRRLRKHVKMRKRASS